MRPHSLTAGLLVLLFAGGATWVWFRPVPDNFVHYLGWRFTSAVQVEQGEITYIGARIRKEWGRLLPLALISILPE